MNPFQYQPLAGLLSIDKKEIEGVSVLDALSYAEEKIRSSPKGRAKDLALLLMIVRILAKANIPFYVKGGILMQYRLGDHSRPTNDIDVLVPLGAGAFHEKAKDALENYQGELSFQVSRFRKSPASKQYLYDSFCMFVYAWANGVSLGRVMLEGACSDIFHHVDPVRYQGPDFIEEGFSFLGVPIEYVFAEKVLAVTSELPRPYKHLVDAYSLSKIDIDVDRLKKYLKLILEEENVEREKLGMSTEEYRYLIKPDKAFTRNYVFAVLQAGYRLDEKQMIGELNAYFSSIGL